MSRWFRSYIGTARDPKFVGVAVKACQTIERVHFVWSAVCEDAAANGGRGFEVNSSEIAEYLDCNTTDIDPIVAALENAGLTENGEIAGGFRSYDARLPWNEWVIIRAFIFERDGYTCQYCGATNSPLECDHVFPIAKGGGNDPENLKAACSDCNRSKRDKTLDEWQGRAH